jgi:hypothetical protein
MNVLFLSPLLAVTLIEPCLAADNYEIVMTQSSYSTLEYTHHKAMLCEVDIYLGDVLKVKSSCVAYGSYNDTLPVAANVQSVSNSSFNTFPPHDTSFDGVWRLNKNGGFLEYCALRSTLEPIVYNGNAYRGDSKWTLGCLPVAM